MSDSEVRVGAAWEEHQGLQGCSSTSTATDVNICFCTNLDFCPVFPLKNKQTNKKTCTQEGSYRWDVHYHLHTVCHISKVVCRVITARLPPAAEVQHVSLIFCVRLLHISLHRETFYWSWALQPHLSRLDHLCTHPTTKNSVMEAGTLAL